MQTNNKLREALEAARLFVTNCNTPLTTPLEGCGMSRAEVMNIIDTALADPVKNCEVGTAMEQGERFAEYCHQHKHPESECLLCPLFGQTGGYCELAWAQLPYEEGGAK